MNILRLSITLILIGFMVHLSSAQETTAMGDIEVSITGLGNDKGRIHLALYKSKESFPKDSEAAYMVEMARIIDGSAQAFFDGVPYGKYAIALFHDENNNGKLDYGILGIPKEGFGFSNNPKAWFGPPSFESASFLLDSPKRTITIKVAYGIF